MSLVACSVSGAVNCAAIYCPTISKPGRGQVKLVEIEQELAGNRRAGDAAGVGERGAGQPGQAVCAKVRLDPLADQVEVEVMDHHAVGGIARQRVAHGPVEALVKGVADREGGCRVRLSGDFGDVGGVARKVADGRRAGSDQQVESSRGNGSRGGARGWRAHQRSGRDRPSGTLPRS